MFTLVDGRNELYQWDLNRQIAVSDPEVTEVHFCNRTDDCSLVVEVKNGIANIPNILLQDTWDIRVYAYCNEYTKVEERFKVKARTKPADYIYTETEVKTIEDIEKRMNDIEAIAKGAVGGASFMDYPELVAALNAATETEYAQAQHLFVRTLGVPDLWIYEVSDNHVAYEYVNDEAIADATINGTLQIGYYVLAALETQKVDLNEYVKKKVGGAANSVVYGQSWQGKETWYTLEGSGKYPNTIPQYQASSADNKRYVLKSFYEPAADEDLANKKYVDAAIANIEIPEGGGGSVDLTGYATEEFVQEQIANIPECESGIFFMEDVGKNKPAPEAAIAAINYYKAHGHVSIYVKPMTETYAYLPTTFQCSDDYNFYIRTLPDSLRFHDDNAASFRTETYSVTSADNGATWTWNRQVKLADLVTETELTNKGYQTAAQVNTAIETALEGIEIPEADVDLSNYYTKAETEALIPDVPSLEGYATKKYVDDSIAAIDIPEGGGGGGSDWIYTTYIDNSDIYNAREIYIRVNNMGRSNKYLFSHFIADCGNGETLGTHYPWQSIAFTTVEGNEDGVPCWDYDANGIHFYCLENYGANYGDVSEMDILIAYKT